MISKKIKTIIAITYLFTGFIYIAGLLFISTTALASNSTPTTLANQYNIVAADPPTQTTDEQQEMKFNCKGKTSQECLASNPIYHWINIGINLLVVISLVGAVIMVVIAGLQYVTSDGSPEKAKSARDKIWNVVIGILVLAFMYAFLQWLIPGGAFSNYRLPASSGSSNSTESGNTVNTSTTITTTNNPSTSSTVTALDKNKVKNFRDAGGSGFLKSGILYRSANLNKADPSEVSGLLDGGTIIDLRTASVIKKTPDVSVSGVNYTNIPIHGTTDYTEFVTNADSRKGFGQAINTIANSNGKVLLHCTYGKDRTGWTVAMIMYAMGASSSQVKKEYLKSSGVNEAMLNAGLSKAKAKYGSIDKYISKGLGVSDSTIAELKAKLGK